MESFDGLYEMYHMPIYRFACALAGNTGDAEDLFQEVWLRAAKAFRKGAGAREDAGDARSWLFAIAARAALLIIVQNAFMLFFAPAILRAVRSGAGGLSVAGGIGTDTKTRRSK